MSVIDTTWATQVISAVSEKTSPEVAHVFERCFLDTLKTTIEVQEDGGAFVVTGDIPAMWLRDSAWQMAPYVHFADRVPQMADLVGAVVRQQMRYIQMDPYANAFNVGPTGECYSQDITEMTDWIWERKYELDSLCAPIILAVNLWRVTGSVSHLDGFIPAMEKIIDVIRTEQDHENASPYSFVRPNPPTPTETLVREGKGSPVAVTGMTWSAFRPSDDATTFGYNIPGNFFAVVALRSAAQVLEQGLNNQDLAKQARTLADEIYAGIMRYGIVTGENGEQVFAYEVDGFGEYICMDDANLPSLLSLPYLGVAMDENMRGLYSQTRKMILSEADPYFYSGVCARGIGSPHSPDNYVWPIALSTQGLTSTHMDERQALVRTLISTTGGTDLMHESFDVNDPMRWTRDWFSWANAMFCEFVLDMCNMRNPKITDVSQ